MARSEPPTAAKLFYNAINGVIAAAAKAHVNGFWGDKGRVPFVASYNEGMRRTNTWSENLGLIGALWVVTTLVEAARLLWN